MARPPRFSHQTVAVLEELLRRPSARRYGYDLMKSTGLAAGTLYPILARLTECGWLEGEWDEPAATGRPPRQNYRLTPTGRVGARDMVARTATGSVAVARR